MPEISIKPEVITKIAQFPLTNSFLASIIVLEIFSLLAFFYKSQLQTKRKSSFFYVIQFILKYIYELFHSIVGEEIGLFFPLLGALFVFILLNNWFGLLPGVGSILFKGEPLLRGGSADLNTTFALAIIAVGAIQYFGVKFLGFKTYISKFITIKDPISAGLGVLDILSEFSRILSFSFRLFGNVFAGEVLLIIIAFLVPFIVPFPFLLMEIFVGLIQALVFAMLTSVFLKIAITKHH